MNQSTLQWDLITCDPRQDCPFNHGGRGSPLGGDVHWKPLLQSLILKPFRYHNLDALWGQNKKNWKKEIVGIGPSKWKKVSSLEITVINKPILDFDCCVVRHCWYFLWCFGWRKVHIRLLVLKLHLKKCTLYERQCWLWNVSKGKSVLSFVEVYRFAYTFTMLNKKTFLYDYGNGKVGSFDIQMRGIIIISASFPLSWHWLRWLFLKLDKLFCFERFKINYGKYKYRKQRWIPKHANAYISHKL